MHRAVLPTTIKSYVGIAFSFHLIRFWPRWQKIRGVEIVFSGDADEGEQGVAPGIGEGRPHAMRLRRIGNGTDRPVRRNPFAGRVREHCREINGPGRLIDRRRLHRGDLMLTECLAHYVEAARQ